MQSRLVRLTAATGLILSAIGSGCGYTPKPKPVTARERLRQDSLILSQVTDRFERQLSFRSDIEVSVYMRKLAQRLADGTEALKDAPVGVHVIRDRDKRWRNFGLAGNRIYLSSGLVRKFEFENQLAAAMAYEFANIVRRQVILRLEKRPEFVPLAKEEGDDKPLALTPEAVAEAANAMRPADFFGPAGIFAFDEEEQLASVETAVEILHQAGFDTRGLVSLWQLYQENPKHSPFERSTLAKLLEKTRTVYAAFPPLRNPIVRSEEFLRIRKRIERL